MKKYNEISKLLLNLQFNVSSKGFYYWITAINLYRKNYYKYLEDNQTLIKIPVNSQVVLATDVGSKDSGSVISGAVFITDTVVEYVTKLGEISLDEIIERYATDIKEEEIKKKGFFGGLFAKK